MNERTLNKSDLDSFEAHLRLEEKSMATIEKYLRDGKRFLDYAGDEIVTKELVVAYKQYLVEQGYAIRSINSMIASTNSLLAYLGLHEYKVKSIRQQRKIYCAEDVELTFEEYLRLLDAAQNHPQLCLLIKTICGTGIRVSELRFFTVEAVCRGEIVIFCKNKTRSILIPENLQKILLDYSQEHKIFSGPIFISRNGIPLDRSNIWGQMKKLCKKANLTPSKVFPHNLRKLFAKTFYGLDKDIAKLADILGHSSIDTTRIYIMTSGIEHRKKIEQLGLVI